MSGMLLLPAILAGCSTVGPGTITRDRFDYTTAVADSWKRQMLLNIVKIRYGDAPIFLEVASITMEPEGEGIRGPMVRIHFSYDSPKEDFAVVPYRNLWFWIDDRDYRSKKLFSFLMFVMTLTETGVKEGAPVLTISAGG